MRESSSIREWVVPVLGIALGLYFGYVVGLDGSLAALASFALVIVPVIIWISPKRTLLGWQLPIISFSICSVLTHSEYPGQPFDLPSDLLMAVMEWTGLLRSRSGLRDDRQLREVGPATCAHEEKTAQYQQLKNLPNFHFRAPERTK